jgi:hypothetical protein
MSTALNIIPLEPKSLTGKQRNITWAVNYQPSTKKFKWTVTIVMQPQVFTGDCDTMKAAEKEVDMILSKFR